MRKKAVLEVIIISSLLLIICIKYDLATYFYRLKSDRSHGIYHYNLIPFSDLKDLLKYGIYSRIILLILNGVTFFYIGTKIHSFKFKYLFLLLLVAPILKEILQLLLCLGIFNIDNILVNTVSIFAGYKLYFASK